MSLHLIRALEEQLREIVLNAWPQQPSLPIAVAVPTLEGHGDLSTPIAMTLAKRLREQPLAIADRIAAVLHARECEYIAKIEIKHPGFINFFLNDAYLAAHAHELTQPVPAARAEKIVIEHTNVNPNKAMHIGHLRNAVLGDALNRVLQKAGFITEVQYYVDDTGVQVADTYVGLQELGMQPEPGEKFDHFCWRVYAAINERYATEPALLEKRTATLHEIEDRSSETAQKVKELATKILQDHLKTMADFSIEYDLLAWESDILASKFWERAFEILKQSKHFVQETKGKNAGCWVLKTGEEQEDEEHSPDKVIVKSDGTVTYTGKDIAYHLWKFNLLGSDFTYQPWQPLVQHKPLMTTSQDGTPSTAYGHADRVYNVIDFRQAYPQAMVRLALESLGYTAQAQQLRHVSYNVVSLSPETAKQLGASIEPEKRSQSMSGRKGLGVKVDDVLQQLTDLVSQQAYAVTSERAVERISPHEIAMGALKYFMLRYNPNTEIVFDFAEALSLEGNTGPYLQYAHARAAGILDKSGEAAFAMPAQVTVSAEEHRLLAALFRWPQLLEQVAEDLNLSRITTYAFDLAETFNSFYEACPVLKAEGPLRQQRLALVYAYRQVLADVLQVLGIVAPQQM